MNPYIQEANQQFVSVYNRYPIVLDHGEGMYLYDTEGKKYLDFGSGIGVCGLGYHDPQYTRMLHEQIEKLLHTSNLFYNVPAIEAAKLFNQAAAEFFGCPAVRYQHVYGFSGNLFNIINLRIIIQKIAFMRQ